MKMTKIEKMPTNADKTAHTIPFSQISFYLFTILSGYEALKI